LEQTKQAGSSTKVHIAHTQTEHGCSLPSEQEQEREREGGKIDLAKSRVAQSWRSFGAAGGALRGVGWLRWRALAAGLLCQQQQKY